MTEDAIGVVGLGKMGFHVAANYGKSQYRAFGYDKVLDDSRMSQLIDSGVTAVPELGDLLGAVDVLVTVLPDSEVVDGVARQLLTSKNHVKLWIDLTSGLPERSRLLSGELAEAGILFVDAPSCNGGVPGIAAGTNLLCLGGSDEAIDVAKPYLEVISGETIHVGPVGSGHLLKLLCNAIKLGVGGLVAEAFAVGLANDLELPLIQEALRKTVAGSTVQFAAIERDILQEPNRKDVSFPVRLAAKDLRYFAAEAGRAGVPVATVNGALTLLQFASRAGLAAAPALGGPYAILKGTFGQPS